MARPGGLFHVFRTIPKAFKKKRRFDNELHKFRRRLPNHVRNSTAQNWHKAAQKSQRELRFRSLAKPACLPAPRHAISIVEHPRSSGTLARRNRPSKKIRRSAMFHLKTAKTLD
jgi:hypothetical protein